MYKSRYHTHNIYNYIFYNIFLLISFHFVPSFHSSSHSFPYFRRLTPQILTPQIITFPLTYSCSRITFLFKDLLSRRLPRRCYLILLTPTTSIPLILAASSPLASDSFPTPTPIYKTYVFYTYIIYTYIKM